MIKYTSFSAKLIKIILVLLLFFTAIRCNQETKKKEVQAVVPDYFLLHPKLEKTYGYSQAVRIGNVIKISGVVSIDDEGNPTRAGDFLQQMKNCYLDIDKVLKHYGCTFDDVVVENLYTTSMNDLKKNASYRKEIYKKHFPTGSWIGVKELGLPQMMIEIELEAYTLKK